MEKINLYDYYKKYGFNAVRGVINAYGYNFAKLGGRKGILKRTDIFVDVPTEEETISLMSKINKAISNPNYNSTIRNRFYQNKHQIIKYFLETHNVSAVESDGYYKFNIYGHEFHQPKFYFSGENLQFTVVGQEEYNGKSTSNFLFSDKEWKDFIVGRLSYCAIAYQLLRDEKC